MITTIIAVAALVAAVCAFFTAIVMGAATPSSQDVASILDGKLKYYNCDAPSATSTMKMQMEYQRGYNDAYVHWSRLVDADTRFRARSVGEQEQFAVALRKATEPLHKLEKDLGLS